MERVHPSIDVEIAPDRDAIVLTGLVPDLIVSQTAEAVARNYLEAGGNARSAAQPFIAAPPVGVPDAGVVVPVPGAALQNAPQQAPAAEPGPSVQLQGTLQPSGSIINPIRLESLPATPEQKIQEAVQAVAASASPCDA